MIILQHYAVAGYNLSMPKTKIILALGFFIALLPVLGFPYAWEAFFQVAVGLSIVLLSVMVSIDRRLMLKARGQKRQARKRMLAEVQGDENRVFGRRATDGINIPGHSAFGRRASDMVFEDPESSIHESDSESV